MGWDEGYQGSESPLKPDATELEARCPDVLCKAVVTHRLLPAGLCLENLGQGTGG